MPVPATKLSTLQQLARRWTCVALALLAGMAGGCGSKDSGPPALVRGADGAAPLVSGGLEAELAEPLRARTQVGAVESSQGSEPELPVTVPPGMRLVETQVRSYWIDKEDGRRPVAFEIGVVGTSAEAPVLDWGEAIYRGVMPAAEKAKLKLDLIVPEGAAELWCRAVEPGLTRQRAIFEIPDRGRGMTLWVRCLVGVTVEGLAVDEAGRPVAAGDLRFHCEYGKNGSARLFADGTFEVNAKSSAEGPLVLDAGERGAGMLVLGRLDGVPGSAQDLRLVVRTSGELRGRVVSLDGRRLAGLDLRLVHGTALDEASGGDRSLRGRKRVGDGGLRCASIRTDADGSFVGRGLTAGGWAVFSRSKADEPWRRLHAGLLALGGGPYDLQLDTRRLLVRLRLPSGDFAPFAPRDLLDAPGSEEWKPFGDGWAVTARPSPQVIDHFPIGYSFRGRKVDAHEWFATEDPTTWELSLPKDTPYWIGVGPCADGLCGREVVLASDQITETLVLEAPPNGRTGQLKLTVVDPEGTNCLRGYTIRVETETGRLVAQGFHSHSMFILQLAPKQPYSCLIDLPAGRHAITVFPIHASSGQMCGSGYSPQLAPGPVRSLVDIVAGEETALELHTKARALLSMASPKGAEQWKLVVRSPGEKRSIVQTEIGSDDSYGTVELPPGRFVAEAVVAGVVVRRERGVLEVGEQKVFHGDRE